MLLHYAANKRAPTKYDLANINSKDQPAAIFGHFNKKRGFGIEHYYPKAEQFITILRDPFERAISLYFYKKQKSKISKNQINIDIDNLRDYLLSFRGGAFNHFPREVTLDNYKEIIETYFIEIGVTEHLDESMIRISNKLNKSYKPGTLKMINVAERNERIPLELKELAIENMPLEYAMYNYVLAGYTQNNSAPAGSSTEIINSQST